MSGNYDSEKFGEPSILSAAQLKASIGTTDNDFLWLFISDLIKTERIRGKILDIGCGSGYHDFIEAEYDSISEIIGVDINPKCIDSANIDTLNPSTDSKLKFINDNIVEYITTIDDNSFDCVQSYSTLEHFYPDDLEILISNIYRILKSGGYFTTAVPNEHSCDCSGHKNWWSSQTFGDLFVKHGFEIERCWFERNHGSSDPNYGCIAGIFKKTVPEEKHRDIKISVIIPVLYVSPKTEQDKKREFLRVKILSKCLMSFSKVKFGDGDEIVIAETGEKQMLKRVSDSILGHLPNYRYMFVPSSQNNLSIVPAQYEAMRSVPCGNVVLYSNSDVLVKQNIVQATKDIYNRGDRDNNWVVFLGHHMIMDTNTQLHNVSSVVDSMNNNNISSKDVSFFKKDQLLQYLTNSSTEEYSIQTTQFLRDDPSLYGLDCFWDSTNNQIVAFPYDTIRLFTDDGSSSFFSDMMWFFMLSHHGYFPIYEASSTQYFHILDIEQSKTYFSKCENRSYSGNEKFFEHKYRWIDQYPDEVSSLLVFELTKDRVPLVDAYLEIYSQRIGSDVAHDILERFILPFPEKLSNYDIETFNRYFGDH